MGATGSMISYADDVSTLMSTIVRNLTIGETTSRVALVSYNAVVWTHWDFTSPICYDSARILDGLSTLRYSGKGRRPIDAFTLARDIFREQNRLAICCIYTHFALCLLYSIGLCR